MFELIFFVSFAVSFLFCVHFLKRHCTRLLLVMSNRWRNLAVLLAD